MKRHESSDSLGALMPICPNTTDEQDHHAYTREFQTMFEGLDEENCVEELGQKKRRLNMDQVKALEKNFEVENKLEPDRKVKLAQELGLQPRQVAIWFQNRRARWKTKQLERDYGFLKANYDALKLNYETLQYDNEALLQEIVDLKSKLGEEGGEIKICMKKEAVKSETDEECNDKSDSDTKFENFKENRASESTDNSSAVLNEETDNSPTAAMSSSTEKNVNLDQNPRDQSWDNVVIVENMNCSFQFTDIKAYMPQFVKIEEHNFLSSEESCSTFFSDDQAPTLQYWCCSDEWN